METSYKKYYINMYAYQKSKVICSELSDNQPLLFSQEELRGAQYIGILVMQWGIYSFCVLVENGGLRAQKPKC